MSISMRIHAIEKARREEQRRLMEVYDRDVYWPAMKAARAACEREGHISGRFDNNGLGWTFFYCSRCYGVIEKIGPDDQSIKISYIEGEQE